MVIMVTMMTTVMVMMMKMMTTTMAMTPTRHGTHSTKRVDTLVAVDTGIFQDAVAAVSCLELQ